MMEKIKITKWNCYEFNYRIDNITDLEKILKFLYTKDQISYTDLEYKLSYFTKRLNKEKEIFMRVKRLDEPHWRDGRELEIYEFDDWKFTKPKEFVEFEDTTLSDLTLIYPIKVFKSIVTVVFLLLMGIYVVPNLSPDDWAGIIIGSLFLGALLSISSTSRY